jgi:hypothetical protein
VDLRLHLKLDEASGTTAYDSSTYFNDGTLTGGFDFSSNTVPGAVDGALDFDGIDDNIDCGNDSSLQFGGAITVTAWVKTSSTANYMAIADLEDFSVDGFRFFLSDGQCRSYVMNNGANSWQFGPANLRDGDWHFVCFYSDASTRGGCVDGTFYTTSPVAYLAQANDSFHVGTTRFSDWHFDGAIDDVRVYDRVLSQSEITDIYNLGSP